MTEVKEHIVVPGVEDIEREHQRYLEDVAHLCHDLKAVQKAFEHYKEKVAERQEGRWPY